ncbi:acyltransferase [Neorhizobium sp. T6_25]|uniref:acyltransferase family protein n=1 Tax=Neorhizobium sp. T6_25 TaxID=2093833 RepID=UPI000CF887C6|nr:acyltransferase [Neorhizobium sp. T6_25]
MSYETVVEPCKSSRLPVLDGLRGWGAVFVVLYHVFSEGLPVTAASGQFLRHLLPFNGPFAVLIFFAVSGISLSIGYLASNDNSILIASAASRYFRLAIPILTLCLAVHVVIELGLLAPADQRMAPWGRILDFDTTLAHVVQFSLFDVFFNYSLRWTYAGALWTMSIELFGSLLLFAILLTIARRPQGMVAILLIAYLIMDRGATDAFRLSSLFLFGAVIAFAIQREWVQRIPEAVAVALLLIGGCAPAFLLSIADKWNMLAALALTLGCVASTPVNNVLSCRFSQMLGEISFPLYLVHGPVMLLIGEPLTRNFGFSEPLKLAIGVLVVVVSIVVALPMIAINNVAVRISRSIGKAAASFVMRFVGAIRLRMLAKGPTA